jgi:phosphatidylserine decarboxylase
LFFFFRDPERHPPADSGVIVSPADGTVIYVKEIERGNFPFAVKNNNPIPLAEFSRENLIPDRGIQIGIAMNYLNVHVNRSPIAGVVKMLLPIHGKFLSLKHIHALLENERTLMVFENVNLKVGIVQIASRLVRRIVPYVQEGQTVAQGQRIGMIKFGSQVDLLIPYRADLKVQVHVGDQLVAGESVVMTCDPVTPAETAP